MIVPIVIGDAELAMRMCELAIEDGVFAIVGSPETVRQKIEHYQKELGAGNVLTGCQVGSLSHELARKSMTLLAKDVLPRLRT